MIDAKQHRINWSLKVDIQPIPEIRQMEREQHIRDLQDWLLDNLEKEINMTMAGNMFTKGEEEYEHMLMDLQRLSMGVTVMETDNYDKFTTGEEEDAHRELDVMIDPGGKDSLTKNTTMDFNIIEESLMELGEEEEPQEKTEILHEGTGTTPEEEVCHHSSRSCCQKNKIKGTIPSSGVSSP